MAFAYDTYTNPSKNNGVLRATLTLQLRPALKEIPALDHLPSNPEICFLLPIQLKKTAERLVIVTSKRGLGTGTADPSGRSAP